MPPQALQHRTATLARKRVLYRRLFARRGATAAALATDDHDEWTLT